MACEDYPCCGHGVEGCDPIIIPTFNNEGLSDAPAGSECINYAPYDCQGDAQYIFEGDLVCYSCYCNILQDVKDSFVDAFSPEW